MLVHGQWKGDKVFCPIQGPLTSLFVSSTTVKRRRYRTGKSGSLELTLMPEKRLEVKLKYSLLQFNKFQSYLPIPEMKII
jgi:hypothetical protein